MAVRATCSIEFGWVGWGASGDLVPELRLGWVRVWCCRGGVFNKVASLNASLRAAKDELSRMLKVGR